QARLRDARDAPLRGAPQARRAQLQPALPVNTLQLMRGAVAAEAEGALAAYVEAVFQHMWERPKKMDDPEVIRVALTESGLDADHLLVRAQDQRVKDALAASTQRASSAAPSASRRSSSAARCSSARTGCATWRRRSHARPRDDDRCTACRWGRSERDGPQLLG